MKTINRKPKAVLWVISCCLMLASLASMSTLSSCSGCNSSDTDTTCNCAKCKDCKHCHNDTGQSSVVSKMDLCQKDTIPLKVDSLGGLRMSMQDAQALAGTISIADFGGVKGGRLGKWQLMHLLRSLNGSDPYVYFYFIKEPPPENAGPDYVRRTSVLFIGGNISPDGIPGRLMYRNMGFCPDWCPDGLGF